MTVNYFLHRKSLAIDTRPIQTVLASHVSFMQNIGKIHYHRTVPIIVRLVNQFIVVTGRYLLIQSPVVFFDLA